MKRKILVTVFCLAMSSVSFAQVSDSLMKKFKCKISIITGGFGGSKPKKGALLETMDTSVVFLTNINQTKHSPMQLVIDTFPVRKIHSLIFPPKGKGNFAKGFLIGACLGVLMGLASGDDQPSGSWEDNWFVMDQGTKACILGGCFGLLGGAMASIPIKINIKGNQEKFKLHREKLKENSIRNN